MSRCYIDLIIKYHSNFKYLCSWCFDVLLQVDSSPSALPLLRATRKQNAYQRLLCSHDCPNLSDAVYQVVRAVTVNTTHRVTSICSTQLTKPSTTPSSPSPSRMAPINPQIRPRHKTTRITQQKHRRPSILIRITQPHQHIILTPLLIHLGILEGFGCLSCSYVAW